MEDLLNGIITKHRLDEDEKQCFYEYIENRFTGADIIPADDTDYLRGWGLLCMAAENFGAARVIRQKLCKGADVTFAAPEGIKLEIYDSFAGRIPVIYAEDRTDFESLVTHIVYKGVRPANIEQTGASFVSGKRTRFMILSSKPYSNIPAGELGIPEDDWAEKSVKLRRSHECTHFFTKQTYGIANNLIHDELMADFMGMYDAFGFYKAQWFLRFMGVVEGSGGRLVVYTSGLSPRVKEAVSDLLTLAAEGLERWSHSSDFAALSDRERIISMCGMGATGMALLK